MADSTLKPEDFPEPEKKKRGRPKKIKEDGEPEKKKTRLLTTVEQEVSPMDLPVPDNFDIFTAKLEEMLKASPNPKRGEPHERSYTLNMMVARWCRRAGLSFDDFWNWCKGTPERRDKYYSLYGNLKFDFVREKLIHTLLVITYGNSILKDRNIDRLKELYKLPCDMLLDKKYLEAADIFKAFDCNSIVFLLWSLGGGKTTATIKVIEEEIQKNPDIKVLFVTCRRALTVEQHGKLKGLGFINYMKINKKVYPDYPRFMCSVQSLHLADDDYDLVVFDESETILSSFSGEATTHFHENPK